MRFRLKSPLSTQIELTEACNFACRHCYNYWREESENQRICQQEKIFDLKHFIRIVDIILAQEIPSLTITGGEPFLRREILYPLIERIKAAGRNVGINTNGVLINEQDIEKLEELGVDFILMSVPSIHEPEYEAITKSSRYNRAIEVMKLLAKSKIGLDVNMVISQMNLNSIKDTGKFVTDLGAYSFCATPILACPSSSIHTSIMLSDSQVIEAIEDLLWIGKHGIKVDILEPLVHCMFTSEQRERYKTFLISRSCGAGISDMVVSPNGDIRPCILASEKFGNILNQEFCDIWSGMKVWADSSMLPQGCLDCKIVDICGGGCRVSAATNSGNPGGKDFYMKDPILDLDDCGYLKDYGAPTNNDDVVLDINSRIRLANGVFHRQEFFGGTLMINRNNMFLREDPYKLVVFVSKNTDCSLVDICEKFKIDFVEAQQFVETLIKHGFLQLV